MLELNPDQLRVLRHMLGINRPEMFPPIPYRNYYCANPGEDKMLELVRSGAIRQYDARGGYEWYECTEEGRAAGIASHKTIRLSPAQRRYSRFLDARECNPDLTFHKFLTDRRYQANAQGKGEPR